MRAILDLIVVILDLYRDVVIAAAIMSWLVAFGIINRYNRFVSTVGDVLFRLTEPALRPIRNFLPDLGGVDISPIVLLVLIWFIEHCIYLYVYPYVP